MKLSLRAGGRTRNGSGAPRWRTTRISAVAVGSGLLALSLLLLAFWGERVGGTDPLAADHSGYSALSPGTRALVERLQATRLVNGRETNVRLRLDGGDLQAGQTRTSRVRGGGTGFLTRSPFVPRYRESYRSLATLRYPLPDNPQSYELNERDRTFSFHGQEQVLRWYSSLSSNTSVCGVQFLDANRVDYRLRTFPDRESAIREGYVVTHRYHCGTCSSLRDLAVYMGRPDLVSPVRACARRLTPSGIKACLLETVGFEERCAETWTYNVLHTRRRCLGICIEHYGFWNVVTNDMSDAHTDGQGSLNPCLACDEYASGPGFQYAAGRTRRASGLESSVDRPAEDIYPVDHRLYFE